jgi:hypothetical protein
MNVVTIPNMLHLTPAAPIWLVERAARDRVVSVDDQ